MSELPRRAKRERRSKRKEEDTPVDETSSPTSQQSNNNNNYNHKNRALPIINRKIERIKMSIPSKMVGFLIGHRGYSILALRQRTNCQINVKDNKNTDKNNNDNTENDKNDNNDKNDSKQNNNNDNNNNNKSRQGDSDEKRDTVSVIELVGTTEEIAACRKEIEFMVDNGRFMMDSERGIISKSNEKEIAVDMKIPAKVCGMLIGGKGEAVNELMLVTGCEIWVERDDSSHIEAGVATVHLKGKPNSVSFAQQEIRHVLSLWGTAGGMNASQLQFELPSFVSKTIIGENGVTIRLLQTTFRCSIRIKRFKSTNYKFDPRMNKDIQNTCQVTITGEPEDCDECKKGIDDLIGLFTICKQCKKYVLSEDGRADEYMNVWYCNYCWKEYDKPDEVPDKTPETPDGTPIAQAAPAVTAAATASSVRDDGNANREPRQYRPQQHPQYHGQSQGRPVHQQPPQRQGRGQPQRRYQDDQQNQRNQSRW